MHGGHQLAVPAQQPVGPEHQHRVVERAGPVVLPLVHPDGRRCTSCSRAGVDERARRRPADVDASCPTSAPTARRPHRSRAAPPRPGLRRVQRHEALREHHQLGTRRRPPPRAARRPCRRVASASSTTGVACTAATRTVGKSVIGRLLATGDPSHTSEPTLRNSSAVGTGTPVHSGVRSPADSGRDHGDGLRNRCRRQGQGPMTRRWPLLAALAYALFGVIGLFLLPTAPDVDATGQELVAHLDEHSGAIRVVIWLVTLALLAFVPLAAAIREHLVGIGRDVTLIGATSVAILTTVWTWTNAGLALHADTLDPGVARTFTDVAAYYGPTLTAMVILFAAPVGWAAWHRQGGLPRSAGLGHAGLGRRAVHRDDDHAGDERLPRPGRADEPRGRGRAVPSLGRGRRRRGVTTDTTALDSERVSPRPA